LKESIWYYWGLRCKVLGKWCLRH